MTTTTNKSKPPKTRRKHKYGDIRTEDIVAAALSIVKRDGAMGLSMRALAAKLNVSTMATYYYVPNKDALIELVMDKVYSAITVSDISGTPEERLHTLFWKSLRMMRQYPGLMLLSAVRTEGKEFSRLSNEVKELFRKAGYSDRYTEAGFLLVALLQYGAMMLESDIGSGVAGNAMERKIEQNLDDGLSLIFAGLKSFGDKEHSETTEDGESYLWKAATR